MVETCLFACRPRYGGNRLRCVGAAKRRQLGVLMSQVDIGEPGSPNLQTAQVLHLPLKAAPQAPSGEITPKADDENAAHLAQAYERFQVQVRLDVEQERELLYKSLLVVEVIIFLLVFRELMLKALA